MDSIPDWLNSTLASDASGGSGVLPLWIRPLKQDTKAVGPACIVLTGENDNLAVRETIQSSPPAGSILVVAGASASRTAIIGELLALEMHNAGVVALVTDGLVRDSKEIKQMQHFYVWSRGVTPSASDKKNPAGVVESISIGDVLIRNGDLVIADDDGVVIWPREHIDTLLEKAEEKFKHDNERLASM